MELVQDWVLQHFKMTLDPTGNDGAQDDEHSSSWSKQNALRYSIVHQCLQHDKDGNGLDVKEFTTFVLAFQHGQDSSVVLTDEDRKRVDAVWKLGTATQVFDKMVRPSLRPYLKVWVSIMNSSQY